MIIVGECTDKEVLEIMSDHYDENSSEYILPLLTGADFKKYHDENHSDNELGY